MPLEIEDTAEHVLAKVLGLIILFALLGGLAVSFFASVKTLVTAFNDTSATGNTTMDGVIAVFGLIVAVIAVFAIIKLLQHTTENY